MKSNKDPMVSDNWTNDIFTGKQYNSTKRALYSNLPSNSMVLTSDKNINR